MKIFALTGIGIGVLLAGSTFALRDAPPPPMRFQFERLLHPAGEVSPSAGDFFAASVAMSDDAILIGAPLADERERSNVGAAYHFDPSNGLHVSTLQSDAETGEFCFAESVAISGSLALVGHPHKATAGTSGGAAYVYARDPEGGWTKSAELVPELAGEHRFGVCVALDGNVAAVAAKGEQGIFTVYVFQRDQNGNWREAAKLERTSSVSPGNPRLCLALRGSRLLVGDPNRCVRHEMDGAAVLYERDGSGNWQQTAEFTSTNPTPHGYFGWAVVLTDKEILIGEPGLRHPGAVHVLRPKAGGGPWRLVQRLASPHRYSGKGFGRSLGVAGDRLAVGAPLEQNAAGAVYVFQRSAGQWTRLAKMTPHDPQDGSRFGDSLALTSDALLIGARQADGTARGAGAAFLHRFASSPPRGA